MSRGRLEGASERGGAAYQTLHRAIIEQALPPGTRLREEELAAHFGISRTLVRDALAQLVSEGLVERPPRRSAMVARPTLKEAQDAFALRHILELEVVRQLAGAWKSEFGVELEQRISEEEAALSVGDGSLSIRLAGEFHLALARMSENALLAHYLGEIVSRCSLILALYGRPHSSECAVSEHREILAALEKGDADRAVALMEEHISSVEDRALLTAGKSAGPQLSSILSRYTGPAAARSARPSPDRRPAATRPGSRKAATATRGK